MSYMHWQVGEWKMKGMKVWMKSRDCVFILLLFFKVSLGPKTFSLFFLKEFECCKWLQWWKCLMWFCKESLTKNCHLAFPQQFLKCILVQSRLLITIGGLQVPRSCNTWNLNLSSSYPEKPLIPCPEYWMPMQGQKNSHGKLGKKKRHHTAASWWGHTQ